ncbi:MAG: mobile mystery protein B [Pirellulales bacterium]|nr:mobile mystery protein B [Pirellulales bacterium]
MDDLEGETPLDLREGLLDPSIVNRRQLSIAEAQNLHDATIKYLAGTPSRKLAPFNYTWVLRLHAEMFGKVWDWAGTIRAVELNLGSQPALIVEQLQQLLADLVYWRKHWPDPLEQAVHLHYRAVKIHPFRNGNGRWSRMLASIWLKQRRHPLPVWPAEVGSQVSSLRQEYIDCLKVADAGNLRLLYELHHRLLPK